ncbi:hypothetical protein C8N35_110153 [Breoghania corrubedonensis]|uniref:DUF1214 domain-containing protein n=1 Tax=Breoghania corrubedonensis TaxID=665038 RepID=A0A2T5V1N6_9HYPH|nr:DUF1214 domain-containing protein [Breoghania corrubedonensis]PTW57674.1 hypothetical protein C8N35_110153 [Breoghania corrubedonensis]
MALVEIPHTPIRRLAGALSRARRTGKGERRGEAARPASPRDNWRIDDVPRRPTGRLFLINLLLAVIVALVFGIGTAYLAVDRGRLFGEVRLGQWTAYPTAGTPDADPYSAATTARTGQIPLGKGEGLAFFADRDRSGNRLVPSCDYRLVGQTPPGRLWTLTSTDAHGHLMKTQAGRVALDSRDIVRKPDGDFEITVAAQARPGNWLPVGTSGPLTLVLRLYDTPLTTGSGLAEIAMPEIFRGQCS